MAQDATELQEKLRAFLGQERRPGMATGRVAHNRSFTPVFVCSGQGPQWWGMARQLLETNDVFRNVIEQCDTLTRGLGDWSLVEELRRDEATTRMNDTAIAQPALFALQVGLAAVWKSLGIEPAAVVGHSVGEVAAAHIAGALPLADALRVIYHRGRCMSLAPGGRMLALGITAEEGRQLISELGDKVALAAHNSPQSITLSGDPAELENIASRFESTSTFCRFLPVRYAFHSAQMDPIRVELEECIGDVVAAAPTLPIVSTVTGERATEGLFGGEYWWRNVRQGVRFTEALSELIREGHWLFIELSPHPVLAPSIAQTLQAEQRQGVTLPSLRRDEPDQQVMLGSLGALFAQGYPVDWGRFFPQRGRCIRLPPYPWHRERYWSEPAAATEFRTGAPVHPLLGVAARTPDPSWETSIDCRVLPYLRDHQVSGNAIFPGSGYVEMALAAGKALGGNATLVVEEMQIEKALFLPDNDQPPVARVACSPREGSFAIYARSGQAGAEWTRHASGYVRDAGASQGAAQLDLEALRAAAGEEISHEQCYAWFAQTGLTYGPGFSGIERMWGRRGGALGRVVLPEGLTDEGYLVHPALLDACFQVISGAIPAGHRGDGRLYLPVRIEKVRLAGGPIGRAVWVDAQLVDISDKVLTCNLRIADEAGQVRLAIEGFGCQAVERARSAASNRLEDWLYEVKWHPAPLAQASAAARSARWPAELEPIATESAAEIRELAQENDWFESSERGNQLLNELALSFVAQALSAMGWKPSPGDRVSVDSVMELGVDPRHRNVLRRYLQAFAATGSLAPTAADEWRVVSAPTSGACDELYRRISEEYPAALAELMLVNRCGRGLERVLRAQQDPLELLFPGGSTANLEHLYQDSPTFRYYNLLVAGTVERLVAGLPEDQPLRILEIGGGTAGLTANLLPLLPAHRTTYSFTDVTAQFLVKAKQKFQAYPFVSCQALDIEQDPSGQGFGPHCFDLVLASDVLHATADLRESLRNVRKLLSPGGILLFLEVESSGPWADITFGLTEGWWRFRDHALRPDYPMIDRGAWRALLTEEGFAPVVDFRLKPEEVSAPQVLLMARAPEEVATETATETPAPTAGADTGTWIMLADQGGVAGELAALLERQGHRCVRVGVGFEFRAQGADAYCLDPENAAHMRQLLQAVATDGGKIHGFVHAWMLDAELTPDMPREAIRHAEALGCHAALHLVQACEAVLADAEPTLLLLTRGAQAVREREPAVAVTQAPLIGLGRVILGEYPRIRCRMVDLDPRPGAGEAGQLLAALYTDDPEEEVAIRDGHRFALRLEPATDPPVRSRRRRDGFFDLPFRLTPPGNGLIDGLALRETAREAPGPGQVEVAVASAALNFRDVLKALNLYPTDGPDYMILGDEGSGIVVATGEGVTGFRVGDAVMGVLPRSFGAYAITAADLLMHKPPFMTFAEAATLPIVFMTAYYSLHDVARIQPGETVLIQAAAGGVGLAALQIAKLAGARVFATAGTPDKREHLRALGAELVMDSRTLEFADQVMAATGGRGVDVVLNSLAGQAIAKGLSCLAPYGRFVELGKRDIYENSRFGLWAFRRNVTFSAVDLSRVLADKPAVTRALLADLQEHFTSRAFRPLPHRVFSVSRAAEAFRHMAQGRHMGKVLLSMREQSLTVQSTRTRELVIRPDATYLITGGLGGFGLAIARWLATQGARHLALLGRSGAASEEARRAVDDLRESGVEVAVLAADAADDKALAGALGQLDLGRVPLRGVVHAAMVLDDCLLLQLDTERFRRVMAPKADACWNLHRQTRDMPLDFFVLFSSFSSLAGNPGQGNYAAANAFLDAFAHYRRTLDLPATTINWGNLAEVGYVARHEELARTLERAGFLSIAPDRATSAMRHVLERDARQVAIMRMDWAAMSRASAGKRTPRRMAALHRDTGAGEGEGGRNYRQAILEAPESEQAEMVRRYIAEHIGRVLGTSPSRLDPQQPLNNLGLDSLMAVEFRNKVETELAISLPGSELMQGPTIERITDLVLRQLGLKSAAPAGATRTAEAPAETAHGPAIVAEPLVPLRLNGAGTPLFCIHPAGGSISVYQPLVQQLPEDVTIYAIQAVGNGAEDSSEELEQMACHYARLIQERDPDGPYCLFGFSFGGTVALAIARELERAGKRVAFVGLVEAMAVTNRTDRSQLLRRLIIETFGYLEREAGLVRSSGALDLGNEAERLVERLMPLNDMDVQIQTLVTWLQSNELLQDKVNLDEITRYLALMSRHIGMTARHAIEPVEAPVYLWEAEQGWMGLVDTADNLDLLSRRNVVRQSAPGTHYSVMREPNVGPIARQLEGLMQGLRERHH